MHVHTHVCVYHIPFVNVLYPELKYAVLSIFLRTVHGVDINYLNALSLLIHSYMYSVVW